MMYENPHNSILRKVIDLTLAVYRVTDRFPATEPLRLQIREKANFILASAVRFFSFPPARDIKEHQQGNNVIEEELFSEMDILRGYFAVARVQNWVKEANFDILDSAYTGIKVEIKNWVFGGWPVIQRGAGSRASPPVVDKSKKIGQNTTNLPQRQKKIFEFASKNGKITVADIKNILPGVTIRTARRDMGNLVKSGLLKREISGRTIFFTIKQT